LFSNLICGVAGLTSDANILVNFCRNVAQGYLLTYNSEVPIEHLVKRVCNMKQGYTQNGGKLI
jgi:20S proteasome subunit alpha 3